MISQSPPLAKVASFSDTATPSLTEERGTRESGTYGRHDLPHLPRTNLSMRSSHEQQERNKLVLPSLRQSMHTTVMGMRAMPTPLKEPDMRLYQYSRPSISRLRKGDEIVIANFRSRDDVLVRVRCTVHSANGNIVTLTTGQKVDLSKQAYWYLAGSDDDYYR